VTATLTLYILSVLSFMIFLFQVNIWLGLSFIFFLVANIAGGLLPIFSSIVEVSKKNDSNTPAPNVIAATDLSSLNRLLFELDERDRETIKETLRLRFGVNYYENPDLIEISRLIEENKNNGCTLLAKLLEEVEVSLQDTTRDTAKIADSIKAIKSKFKV
jgi:hypothetical protein